MNSTSKAPRVLIALLVVTSVAFSAWMVLQGRSNYSQPPAIPTATPKAEFVLKYPSKTFWGNYVTASVEAPPGTDCKLTYMSPAGVMHEIVTTANDSGVCEGRWKI